MGGRFACKDKEESSRFSVVRCTFLHAMHLFEHKLYRCIARKGDEALHVQRTDVQSGTSGGFIALCSRVGTKPYADRLEKRSA